MKSKYESHVLPNLEKVIAWAEAGATIKEVAKKLGLSYSTLRKYVDLGSKGDMQYAALSAPFAKACQLSDDAVEVALHKRATGFSYDEMTYETKWDENEEAFVEVCTKRVTKTVPPDPTSAMFWLTNRRKERWKYRPGETGDERQEGGVVLMPPVMEEAVPDA